MSRIDIITQAPSNIALIKYMGKDDASANVPANPSLSMTLDRLRTVLQLTRAAAPRLEHRWLPDLPAGAPSDARVPDLSPSAVERFLNHAAFADREAPGILARHGLEAFSGPASFEIRAANTFPAASGIASSASSFAALTLAQVAARAADPAVFERAYLGSAEFRRDLAALSRRGSGSSCRSFDGPWVLWDSEGARPVPAQLEPMRDFVVLVSSQAKEVSSSRAH